MSATQLSFDRVYDDHFDFVWRTLQRLDVPATRLDDAVQDVFLVVHRRLSDFEHRSSTKTWLYGIVSRVASDYRRTTRRKERATHATSTEKLAAIPDPANDPLEQAQRRESIALLNRLLSQVSELKREVFVLAELEQMTGPEIAAALGLELTTVHSRLRAARTEFEQALQRWRVWDAKVTHGPK